MNTDTVWAAQWVTAFARQSSTIAVSAVKHGISDRGSRESAVFLELFRRVAERGAANELGLCPHLSYKDPSPSYWLAWHPETLRCAACIRAAVQDEIGRDNDDLTCDRCGFVSASLGDVWSGYGQIQAQTPLPLVIICGLCRPCAEGDGL